MKYALYGHTFMKWLMLLTCILAAILGGNSFQEGEFSGGLLNVMWMGICFWAFITACKNQKEAQRRIRMVESGEYERLTTRLDEVHREVRQIKSQADILLTQLIELNKRISTMEDKEEAARLEAEGWKLADTVADYHFQVFRLIQEGSFILAVIKGDI